MFQSSKNAKYEVERKHFAIVFGQILWRLRKKRNWTLDDVTERTGINRSTICRYECNAQVYTPVYEMSEKDIKELLRKTRIPDVFVANRLVKAFDITLDQMIKLCTDLVKKPIEVAKDKEGNKKDKKDNNKDHKENNKKPTAPIIEHTKEKPKP